MNATFANGVACTSSLTTYLNTNYSASVDPTLGTNLTAIPVFVQTLLMNFIDLGTDKTLNVALFLFLNWNDVHLPDLMTTCGPSFNDSVSMNSSLFWLPNIFLASSSTENNALGYWSTVAYGYFDNNTNVGPTILTQVTLACTGMAIQTFPYDTQTCSVTFFAPSDPVVFIAQDAYNGAQDASNDWSVENVSISSGNYSLSSFIYPSFSITITVSRDAYYYLINLVYPTGCMAAMNCLVFVMPCDEGEKTLLSSVLVLSLYVLQQTISNVLPDVSDSDVPFLLSLVNLVFTFSVVSLFESVVVQTILLIARENFPKCLNNAMVFAFVHFCKKEKRNGHKQKSKKDETELAEVTPSGSQAEYENGTGAGAGEETDERLTFMRELVRKRKKELEILKKKSEKDEEGELVELAWIRFQYLINFLVLIAYIIALCIAYAPFNSIAVN